MSEGTINKPCRRPRLLNRRRDPIPPGAVSIERPSKWGNPFRIGEDGDRDEVIAKYAEWLQGKPGLVEAARRELAGHDLVCACVPAACHGEILLALANGDAGG